MDAFPRQEGRDGGVRRLGVQVQNGKGLAGLAVSADAHVRDVDALVREHRAQVADDAGRVLVRAPEHWSLRNRIDVEPERADHSQVVRAEEGAREVQATVPVLDFNPQQRLKRLVGRTLRRREPDTPLLGEQRSVDRIHPIAS